MVKSIPESTRERAREFLGCPGGALVLYASNDNARLHKTPDVSSEDNLVYRPELEAAAYAGQLVFVCIVDEEASYDEICPAINFNFSRDLARGEVIVNRRDPDHGQVYQTGEEIPR